MLGDIADQARLGPALSDEGMRECAPKLMPLLIGATVELLRPVVGTSQDTEMRVTLANRLVSAWGCDPADAYAFVTMIFRLTSDE